VNEEALADWGLSRKKNPATTTTTTTTTTTNNKTTTTTYVHLNAIFAIIFLSQNFYFAILEF
jgi:hypothetical protein